MNDQQPVIRSLSGHVTVIPTETPAETTLPLRALTPAQPRRHTVTRSQATRVTALAAVLVSAVLLIRDIEGTRATDKASITATTTITVSATSPPATVTASADPAAIAPARPTDDEFHTLPLALIGQTLAAAPPDPDPTANPGTQVLHPNSTVPVYDEPGGTAFARLPPRQVFTPTRVPVVARQTGWARVLLPTRPSPEGVAASRWIYLDPAVELSHATRRIDLHHDEGTAAVVAPIAHTATSTSAASTTTTPHRSRTFIAVSAHDSAWLTALWLPLVITHSQICTTWHGALIAPGLPPDSPLGPLDSQGCVTVPDSLAPALIDVPAGTLILSR